MVLIGRVMAWVGAALCLVGAVFWTLGAIEYAQGAFGDSNKGLLGSLLLLAGCSVGVGGLCLRSFAANRYLAANNFSHCLKCGYPFDKRADDRARLTCSECGSTFEAGEARERLRRHPQRVRNRE